MSGPALAYLPSPTINGIHLGPLNRHFYGLMYVIGIGGVCCTNG